MILFVKKITLMGVRQIIFLKEPRKVCPAPVKGIIHNDNFVITDKTVGQRVGVRDQGKGEDHEDILGHRIIYPSILIPKVVNP
jgi:hypothetical protein